MATFITDSVTGFIFQLDATTNITYTSSGRLTQNPIEGGRGSVSDHYIQNPDTISISGILTRVKSKGSNSENVMEPEKYIVNIQDIKNNATPVTITSFQTPSGFFSDQKNLVEPLTDCILESITIRKTSGQGSGDLFLDIKATKGTFPDQSQVGTQPVAVASFQNDASNLENGVGATEEVSPPTLLQQSNRGTGLNVLGVGTGV